MKSNTLFYPLLIVLAAVSLATTGCKHKPTPLTVLPGQTVPPTTTDTPLTPAPPIIQGGDTFGRKEGNIATADINLENYNQDRAAFAANTVHFKLDSSVILEKEQANVAAVAAALNSSVNNKLLIEGHCDERGTEEYNRSLGERRADALREALVGKGVPAGNIKTISYGKDKPVDTGHTEAAFSKNRRGEFILLTPKAGVPGV